MRDGACLDLIKAWNTGHSGGLTTIHANSCELAMQRIESLIAEVSTSIPRELIAQTVNLIVQVQRQGPKRLVTDIKRISGLKKKQYIFHSLGGEYAKHEVCDRAQHGCDVVYLS